MDHKEQQSYLDFLNQDAPLGHEARELVFKEGIRKSEVVCACGETHPSGGIDQESVFWDMTIRTDRPSKKSLEHGDLPNHGWTFFNGKE